MNDFYQTFLHAYGRKLPAPMINPHIHKQKKHTGKDRLGHRARWRTYRAKIYAILGKDGAHPRRGQKSVCFTPINSTLGHIRPSYIKKKKFFY